jgi:hypothetical protein
MCVDIAGIGAGTRIGGHLRYGGGKLRERHRRYSTVTMTNEYRTSQACCYCFQPVIRPRKPVFRDGKWRTKFVSGSLVCYNSACPSYQRGCNTKNRDVEAAINIALAGTSRITTGFTLPPFERSTSHLNTGAYPHHVTKATSHRCAAGPHTIVRLPLRVSVLHLCFCHINRFTHWVPITSAAYIR